MWVLLQCWSRLDAELHFNSQHFVIPHQRTNVDWSCSINGWHSNVWLRSPLIRFHGVACLSWHGVSIEMPFEIAPIVLHECLDISFMVIGCWSHNTYTNPPSQSRSVYIFKFQPDNASPSPCTNGHHFPRRHLQMHFHERKSLYFDYNAIEVCS